MHGQEHPERIAAHYLDPYLCDQMVRIVHRPARLRAMDRAIMARDLVRIYRKSMRIEPLLFGAETEKLAEQLGGALLEWRSAIRDMWLAKRGIV